MVGTHVIEGTNCGEGGGEGVEGVEGVEGMRGPRDWQGAHGEARAPKGTTANGRRQSEALCKGSGSPALKQPKAWAPPFTPLPKSSIFPEFQVIETFSFGMQISYRYVPNVDAVIRVYVC